MKEPDKLLVTVKAAHENLICTLTQEYSFKFNNGHYKYVIMDLDGNIVRASSSICGAPTGMVTRDQAKTLINEFIHYEKIGKETCNQ